MLTLLRLPCLPVSGFATGLRFAFGQTLSYGRKVGEATKDVGNGDAHGNIVEQAKLLSYYELLEIELRTLFNNDATRRRALIDDLRR
jgi:hypothetical protein